jgi:hypothetical protein
MSSTVKVKGLAGFLARTLPTEGENLRRYWDDASDLWHGLTDAEIGRRSSTLPTSARNELAFFSKKPTASGAN